MLRIVPRRGLHAFQQCAQTARALSTETPKPTQKNDRPVFTLDRMFGTDGIEVAHSSKTRAMHAYTVDASTSQSESVLPYKIIEGRGSRVISLASREGQALIGRSTAVALANRIRKYENNSWAEVLVFASTMDQAGFCEGIDTQEWAEYAQSSDEFLRDIYALQESITRSPKTIITWLDGNNNGTGLSLAKREFVVATESTRVQLNELAQGYLPMLGASQLLAKAKYSSVAMASYLGCSGRVLHGSDLYALGIASHISSREGLALFVLGLGETITDVDPLVPFHKSQVINKHACEVQLDAVCMTTPSFVAGFVHNEELQRQVEPVKVAQAVAAAIDVQGPGIEACFSEGSVENVVGKLREMQEQAWAHEALANMQRIDPLLLKAWHYHCNQSKKMAAGDLSAAEIAANSALLSAGLQKANSVSETLNIDVLVKELGKVSNKHVENLFKVKKHT